MRDHVFHIPPGRRQEVQIVNLPVIPSRQLPVVMVQRLTQDILVGETAPRRHFMEQLSKQESALVEELRQRPYASTEELSSRLQKSGRTVENQLRSIYSKLAQFYDLKVPQTRKRQVLLDVIHERV